MDIPVLAGFSEAGLSDAKSLDREGLYWTEEAFERFFLDNYARLAGVIFRIVGDYSRAEELTDEAFWRLYRQPYGGNKFNPSGWVYRTATRLAIDSLRADARRGRYEQEAGASLIARSKSDPLEGVLEAERRAQVRKALTFLRPLQAQLLILRASGFKYQELAEILKVKAASVGTRLIRAEAAFRKRYFELYGK
ncbi:MAG TPA: sigma-70 family RNA polymerase sigma factor [Terriglobia bacterium]|nr:sigma-70 family RNA polymerase sigma factor [Terriglobia bacterium]